MLYWHTERKRKKSLVSNPDVFNYSTFFKAYLVTILKVFFIQITYLCWLASMLSLAEKSMSYYELYMDSELWTKSCLSSCVVQIQQKLFKSISNAE